MGAAFNMGEGYISHSETPMLEKELRVTSVFPGSLVTEGGASPAHHSLKGSEINLSRMSKEELVDRINRGARIQGTVRPLCHRQT